MKIGDLVQLNKIYFDLNDEIIGIVIEVDKMVDIQEAVRMIKVAWLDHSNGPPIGWYDENELEIINGCR